MNYLPIELHTHSIHSDGKLEIKKLIEEAKDFGYEAIFLTDHNTMSGHEEVEDLKQDYPVYKGVEWSCFYGHMLILGTKETYDWTKATIDNLDELILQIKKEGNFAFGIAHPCLIGGPLCVGCHWDFMLKDYNLIDCMEVYNGVDPQKNYSSDLNYQFWLEKVLQGYKIAPVSGRDWHVTEREKIVPITYLGIEGELSEETAINALIKGRTYVSLGPRAEFSIKGKKEYKLGESAPSGNFNFNIRIEPSSFMDKHKKNIIIDRLLLFNSEKLIEEKSISYKENLNLDIKLKRGFFRFELIGFIDGKEVKLIIPSPLWIE